MPRARRAVLALAVALLAACVVSVPAASAADVVLPFTNYKVGGSLTVKKLNQSITLPGGIDLQRQREPDDAAAVRQRLHPGVHVDDPGARRPDPGHDEARRGPAGAGDDQGRPEPAIHIRSTTSAILRIKKLRLGLLGVPTTCRTAEPIQLTLNYDGPLAFPLAFDGTTTIPRADRLRAARPDARHPAVGSRQRRTT